MEVKDSTPVKDRHSIEWGNATWTEDEDEDNKDFSIRNRYDKEGGGYNHTGSKEIPWWDFNSMIIESIKRNHFSKEELANILKEISEHIKK
jgi:hypothetical protein